MAAGLTWNSVRTITARTEASRLARARRGSRPAHPAGSRRRGESSPIPAPRSPSAPRSSGRSSTCRPAENAAVRKGDLLVELRADEVKASLREAHFRLIEAEAGLRLLRARFQLDRIFPSPAGKAPQAADHRDDEQAAAVARRDAAKAAVERLEAEAVKYRITAPIDGVVISRHVDPGETVTPGSALVTIVDLSRLRVEAEVDEFDIAGITLSAKATITAEGYSGRRLAGPGRRDPRRRRRPPDPSRGSRPARRYRVLRVKVAFREPNPLKLGQHVEVEIARGRTSRDSQPITVRPAATARTSSSHAGKSFSRRYSCRVDDGIRTRDIQIHNLVP